VNVNVTVYSTGPECQKCKATKRGLEKLGIPHVEKPVTEEIKALAQDRGLKMVAPIVHAVVGGEDRYWSDFRPDMIKSLTGD